mmetsp:Transcript_18764/g.18868  ORF Transcript_18764/g.18868 Transcript_18764/m.18868 type:complete len:292 (-) Transcript_18764:85-960(-)
MRSKILLLLTIKIGLFASDVYAAHGHGSDKKEQSEQQYEEWLKNYKSPDPKNQDYCMNILKSKSGTTSQTGQDLYIFFNFFKYWPMQGKTGFYLDSGANDATNLSNTYFFDICLGWSGLCVEPEERYHESLRSKRTCKIISECISDTNRLVDMDHLGVGSKVNEKSTGKITCNTLHNMLSRVQNGTSNYVIDLWSLDVEGYEMTILESVNFNEIHVRVILVEEFWLATRYLDRKLNDVGYNKFQQLAIDAVYVHRSVQGPIHPWYPISYQADWKQNDDYRQTLGNKLKCSL